LQLFARLRAIFAAVQVSSMKTTKLCDDRIEALRYFQMDHVGHTVDNGKIRTWYGTPGHCQLAAGCGGV
jgi:hypothetical protein